MHVSAVRAAGTQVPAATSPATGAAFGHSLAVYPVTAVDPAKVDAEFFPDGRFKSNFICAVGRGDPASLPPEGYRFSFDEACKVI